MNYYFAKVIINFFYKEAENTETVYRNLAYSVDFDKYVRADSDEEAEVILKYVINRSIPPHHEHHTYEVVYDINRIYMLGKEDVTDESLFTQIL